MSRLIDLTGKRFGMLTVLHRSERPHPRVYWVCQCDCGNVVEVAANNLTTGHSVSCGCRRTNPYIGKRFGQLVVLEKTNETVQHGTTKSPLWKCKCDCGNIVLVRLDSLTSGTTQSCGQHMGEKIKKMRKAAGYINGTQVSRIRNIRPTSANSSGVVGVYFDKNTGKWRSHLTFQGQQHKLGSFSRLEEAEKARKKAEQEWFQPFLESIDEPTDDDKDKEPK